MKTTSSDVVIIGGGVSAIAAAKEAVKGNKHSVTMVMCNDFLGVRRRRNAQVADAGSMRPTTKRYSGLTGEVNLSSLSSSAASPNQPRPCSTVFRRVAVCRRLLSRQPQSTPYVRQRRPIHLAHQGRRVYHWRRRQGRP